MGNPRGWMRYISRFRTFDQGPTDPPSRQTLRGPSTLRPSCAHRCVSQHRSCRLLGPHPTHSERQRDSNESTIRIRGCSRRLRLGNRPRQPRCSIRRPRHPGRRRRHANSRYPSGCPSIRESLRCVARHDARIGLPNPRNSIRSIRSLDRCGCLPLPLQEVHAFRRTHGTRSVDRQTDFRHRQTLRGSCRSRRTASTCGNRTTRSIHSRSVTPTLERVCQHRGIPSIHGPSLRPSLRYRQANF